MLYRLLPLHGCTCHCADKDMNDEEQQASSDEEDADESESGSPSGKGDENDDDSVASARKKDNRTRLWPSEQERASWHKDATQVSLCWEALGAMCCRFPVDLAACVTL